MAGHITTPTTAGPITVPCPKGRCNKPHDPRKCQGHKDLEDGGLVPCGQYPRKGMVVCHRHGGATPQARAAAERRLLEQDAVKAVGKFSARRPVTDPLTALAEVAGEMVAVKDWLRGQVENIEDAAMRTPDFKGGEQMRAELTAYTGMLNSVVGALAAIAKLNIDERLARIDEATALMVIRAIEAALASAGIAGPAAVRAREVVRGHLRMLPGGGER